MPEQEPPDFDDLQGLDGYWMEPTTITVSRFTKAHLDDARNDQPWDSYLQELRRAQADPLTLNDTQEIAESIKDDLSMANEPGVDVDVDGLTNRIEQLEGKITDLQIAVKTVKDRIPEQ